MKGVFDTRPESGYRDELAFRYQFPSQYLAAAMRCVGDWIVYREPRRGGGRQAYIAVARVVRIMPDPEHFGLHDAVMADFLRFDRPVPFRRDDGRYREERLRGLREIAHVGRTLQGHSIRGLEEHDFAEIVLDGLGETLAPENARRLGLETSAVDAEARALLEAPPEERQRRVVQMLVNRTIREASFRRQVCDAYEDTCAVTRLRMINGGGRAEVQAAHIRPVAEGGPDVVQNGIALCATVHWLFDRHLISLSDDYRLLVAHNRVPSELRSLFVQQNEPVHLPKDERLRPSLSYVRRHREAFAAA